MRTGTGGGWGVWRRIETCNHAKSSLWSNIVAKEVNETAASCIHVPWRWGFGGGGATPVTMRRVHCGATLWQKKITKPQQVVYTYHEDIPQKRIQNMACKEKNVEQHGGKRRYRNRSKLYTRTMRTFRRKGSKIWPAKKKMWSNMVAKGDTETAASCIHVP